MIRTIAQALVIVFVILLMVAEMQRKDDAVQAQA